MKVIGHRGAAKIAPENTLKGLRVARNLNLDGVELDIWVTKDKQLVVFHDETLSRLAGVNQKVSNLTLDELKKIKLKSGDNIPSLDDFYKNSRSLPLYIEGKGPGWAEILAKSLKSFDNRDSATVISFNKKELAKFKKLSPSTKTYWITLGGKDVISTVKKNGFDGISILYVHLLNPRFRKELIASKIEINVWPVDHLFIAKFIDRLYPNISFTTNIPHILKKQTKSIGK